MATESCESPNTSSITQREPQLRTTAELNPACAVRRDVASDAQSDTPFFVSNGSFVAGHVLVADTGNATFAKADIVVSMISGDLNNDGFSDLIINKEHEQRGILNEQVPSDVYLNTGGGQFTRAAWHLSSAYGNGLNAPMNSVTLGDL